jgi:D-3-phosphoglycerate dehydrogenase / 2-oxoglutarate reductase
MKDGVRLINVARGGIMQEAALLDGLQSGKIAGAAIDVWEAEPTPADNPLALHPNVVATPHLGASTEEAQVGVAVDIAEQIADVLAGGVARSAVNMPSLAADLLAQTAPYLRLAEKIGSLQSQLSSSGIVAMDVLYEGDFAPNQIVHLTRALMKGLLSPILSSAVNYVNAPTLAQQRGIRLTESRREESVSDEYRSRLIVKASAQSGKTCTIEGTVFGKSDARLVAIDGYRMDFKPEGYLIITRHTDKPGIVGKVGTLLGANHANIAGMFLGRASAMGHAVMALSLDGPVSHDVMQQIVAMEGMEYARLVEL